MLKDVKVGSSASGSKVRNDGVAEWDDLVKFRRDVVSMEMECSAYFECNKFHRINNFGSLRVIIDIGSNKTDSAYADCMAKLSQKMLDILQSNRQDFIIFDEKLEFALSRLLGEYESFIMDWFGSLNSKGLESFQKKIVIVKPPLPRIHEYDLDVVNDKFESMGFEIKTFRVNNVTDSVLIKDKQLHHYPQFMRFILQCDDSQISHLYEMAWSNVLNLIKTKGLAQKIEIKELPESEPSSSKDAIEVFD